MNLSAGELCVVHDASARKEISRALYQGIPWIIYACERHWLGHSDSVIVRNSNVRNYFEQQYKELTKQAKRKLDYFKQYCLVPLRYQAICHRTDKDGNKIYFQELVGYYNGN